MLVYRIENSKRQGPYVNIDNTLCEHSFRVGDKRQPAPENDKLLSAVLPVEDGEIIVPSKYKFGFYSVDQARKWIYKKSWCNSLRKNGFKLVQFEVPDEYCIQGSKQVMYESKRVKTSTKSKACIMQLWKGN